jgi:hypothetical protein
VGGEGIRPEVGGGEATTVEWARDSQWYMPLKVSQYPNQVANKHFIAFQTAVDLALYDAQGKDIAIVKESHLKKVVQMSQSFKDYMKATHENLDGNHFIAYLNSNIRANLEKIPKWHIGAGYGMIQKSNMI